MDKQQIAGEVEQVRGAKRHGGKWRIVLVAGLRSGGILGTVAG